MGTFFLNSVLLMGQQAGQSASASKGSAYTSFIMMFPLITIFWLFLIAPQRKKQKEAQNMLNLIEKGDKVVTIGGIRATVHSVKEDTVVLKVDDNTTIEFNKSAVSSVLEKKNPPKVEEKKAKKGLFGKKKKGETQDITNKAE